MLLAGLDLDQSLVDSVKECGVDLALIIRALHHVEQVPRRNKVHYDAAELINSTDCVLPRILSQLLQALCLLLLPGLFSKKVQVTWS